MCSLNHKTWERCFLNDRFNIYNLSRKETELSFTPEANYTSESQKGHLRALHALEPPGPAVPLPLPIGVKEVERIGTRDCCFIGHHKIIRVQPCRKFHTKEIFGGLT